MSGTRLSAAGISTAMPMPWKTRTRTITAGGPSGEAMPVATSNEATAKLLAPARKSRRPPNRSSSPPPTKEVGSWVSAATPIRAPMAPSVQPAASRAMGSEAT